MKRLSIFALGLLLCIGTAVNAQNTVTDKNDGYWNNKQSWQVQGPGNTPSARSNVTISNYAITLNSEGQAARRHGGGHARGLRGGVLRGQ